MFSFVLLLIFASLVVFVVIYYNRKDAYDKTNATSADEPIVCCGAHEVCDRDNLQIIDTQIEYFDDEELDALTGIAAEQYTAEQTDAIADVLYSMKEEDVAAWLRSLQLRNIQLPDFLREEALMIVAERR